jgi:hypothetical protein
MQHGRGQGILVTMSVVLLLLSTTSSSASAATAAAIASFLPPSNVVAEVSPDLYKYDLHRIGIISFVNRSATPDAGMRVANLFFAELAAHQRFELAPPFPLDEEIELAFSRTAQALSAEERSGRLRQFVREWASRLWPSSSQPPMPDAAPAPDPPRLAKPLAMPLDAVLTGMITRYEDRKGTALFVDQPASVAYEAYLFSVRDGEILWRARFDETQKPLFDNLLRAGRFLRGGAVWQTHDTLARIGLERVLETFPGIAGRPLP